MVREYIPAAGDIVWIDFNPTRGHEQAKLRPALVLSPALYNKRTGMAVMCPITSHIKSYPLEVVLAHKKVQGAILVDQLRSLDWRERGATYCAKASAAVRAEVQEKLAALLFT